MTNESKAPVPEEFREEYEEYTVCALRSGAGDYRDRCVQLIERIARLERENQRLTDLVRYERADLFEAGLISKDEYAALVSDYESGQRVARLEGYDVMRKEIAQLKQDVQIHVMALVERNEENAQKESCIEKICLALGGDKAIPPWKRVEALKGTVERLTAPVSDEEWGETKLLCVEGTPDYSITTRAEVDAIIAARATEPGKRRIMAKSSSYADDLRKYLMVPTEARAYIQAVMEDSTDAMIKALGNVLDALEAALREKEAEIARVTAERDELRGTFDLQWEADQRGIKLWQESHPDKSRVWPDRAKMIFWLLEELDHWKALAEWMPITPDNLPKVEDEVICEKERREVTERDADKSAERWQYLGWTHFRPLNYPTKEPE